MRALSDRESEAPRGLFITFEGPDGSGKTTQAALLVGRLRDEGRDVVAIHEPGGTDLGTDVRALLVRRGWTPIDPRAEALLFSACRAQLVAEVIRPSMERGAIVVADRFADSTLAYQGAGRGLKIDALESLIGIATDGIMPNLTLLLDVPSEVGLARRAGPDAGGGAQNGPAIHNELERPPDWNRFEDEALTFHQRVRAAYLEMAAADTMRWRVIDATRGADDVARAVLDEVQGKLPILR